MNKIVVHQEEIQVVHGRVMHHVLSIGDVGTLACYAILRMHSQYARYNSYTAKNGKTVSGYNLIRQKTGMSLNVLQNKVPSLIRAGLCSFNEKGDLILLGDRKLRKAYYTSKNPKQVFSHTRKERTKWKQRGVKYVAVRASSYKEAKEFLQVLLLHSSITSQTSEKAHKKERLDRLNSYSKGFLGGQTIKEWKKLKKLKRDRPEKFSGYRSDLCLSLKGTAKAVSATTSTSESLGSYYRQKLKKSGLISTQRRFVVVEGFENKLFEQEHLPLAIEQYKELYSKEVGLCIVDGRLCREIASTLQVNTELDRLS